MSLTKNILAIYDSQDKDVLQHLLAHLRPLEKDFHIAILSDDAIHRGQTWKHQSISLLDHADVFLLLLSNTFMHSEFIKQDEFKMVIDSYKEGKATVIPILLDDCPWDVEFTFTDYNFNFKELLVFRQDEMQIGNWGPKDQVYTQVAYYVRGLLTSSTKKRTLLEPVTTGVKAIPETSKEQQIAIDFLEEREANHKVEWERKDKKEAETKKRVEEDNQLRDEAEAKEIIRKAKRLRQKAEIQKRIVKEKTLKEKAKKDRTIEEDVETKRGVQEDIRGNELKRTKPVVEEKKDGETTLPQRETKREKGFGVIVAAPKKTTKKNSLARYNYKFKTAKTVEAKRVVQEEWRGDEEAIAKTAVANKRRSKLAKFQRASEREKRLAKIIAALKINQSSLQNYQGKSTKAINQFFQEAKAKVAVDEIRYREIVSVLKRSLKKNLFVVQNYQVKSAKAINQFFKETKTKVAVDE
ncbi:MAG TPA: TIR domain-containing protein, partial [Pricia sp.]|nr:TIR domain-containing protein [Pricia sp.]